MNEWMKEGRMEGRKEGRKEGRNEGSNEGMTELIYELMNKWMEILIYFKSDSYEQMKCKACVATKILRVCWLFVLLLFFSSLLFHLKQALNTRIVL